jgi:aldose 1-epimerase
MPVEIIKTLPAPCGRELVLFEVTNGAGASVRVMNYGATLVAARMPDRRGRLGDVLLGFDDLLSYLSNPCYLGSTVGRYANRIAGARFHLSGIEYHLDANDGRNCNHGGFSGFDKKWHDHELTDEGVIFRGSSPDGEGGFPGHVEYSVGYRLTEDKGLRMSFRASVDRLTPLSLTNHSYFNLTGSLCDIAGHDLAVYSDKYLEATDEYLPTGRILDVEGSGHDFTEGKKIGEAIKNKNDGSGYNTCYVFSRHETGGMTRQAALVEHDSGRMLEVWSDLPGLQLYTGDYLTAPHDAFSGVALEAQFFPDSPNQAHFPSCVLSPGEDYHHEIEYRFFVVQD